MAKMNAAMLISQLERHGLSHKSVTVDTEGDYLPADVDWNNKDIQHLNYVHAWADDVTAIILEDLQASVSLQKVLGITSPVVIVHYDSGPDHQTHFFTLLAWTIVTDIEFIKLGPMRTRVETTYTVMARRPWMLAFPLIRLLLRRNQRQLMSEDVPMRERRGQLRRWGYTFRGDEKTTRDVRDSINVHSDNVIAPSELETELPTFDPVPIASIDEGSGTLVGRDDHLGLKLIRQGRTVLAFARMCPHEGAALDGIPCTDGHVRCPWHARKLSPVAVVDLDAPGDAVATDRHRITVQGEHLVITVDQPATGPISPAS